MGWYSEEEQPTKKKTDLSFKILLGIIACLVTIIIIIIILLLNVKEITYNISVDGILDNSVNKEELLSKIDDVTYINIEKFSELVGYEYHKGEYKAYTIEEDKCYVQCTQETASFFLDNNKVCKLPLNDLASDYMEFITEKPVKQIDGEMYAPIDAISVAFNVEITETENEFKIYRLSYLVEIYDGHIKKMGYTGISEQNYENQKALLHGYLIVKKEEGLYKVINRDNEEEIIADKYSSIEFNEYTKEFLVTNSLGQVGIINADGTSKIEPIYDSIAIIDKKLDLYLVQKNEKYGIVKSGNEIIIDIEYDQIGIDASGFDSYLGSRYFLFDSLIPVCKNNKWGALDKEGKEKIKLEYDEFGCNLTKVKLSDSEIEVKPLLIIEECKGIVVKKDEKYGLIDDEEKELVPIAVDSIYKKEESAGDEKKCYYMIYKNEELNVIERLIVAGLIKDEDENESNNAETENTVYDNNLIVVDINADKNKIVNSATK